MPLLQGVRNWWRGGTLDGGVLPWLGVPQQIQEKHGSDEDKSVEEFIVWWLEHATDVSWRKIIHSLDKSKETNVADGLRQYAEPPSGVIVF